MEHLPCGGITEIHGGVSSGKTTLAYSIIAGALRAGGCAAWIDVSNAFDPRCARDAGIDVDRVLWVAPASYLMAVRATEYVLAAGGFRVVVLDFGGGLAQVPPGISMAGWLRIDRAATLCRVAIVVLDAVRTVAELAALSLEIRAGHRVFVGEDGPCPSFEGAASCVQVRRLRGGIPDRPLSLFAAKI